MSTHNVCFCEEIRNMFNCYPMLSVAMFVFVIDCFVALDKRNIH